MKPEEVEELFQKELRTYRLDGNQKSWEKLWWCVDFCCSNLAKKLLKGVKAPDFEGKITDATIKCMQKIKDGEDPEKLSSYCYWPVFGVLFDRKLQKEERTISLEAWLSHEYAKEEEAAKK